MRGGTWFTSLDLKDVLKAHRRFPCLASWAWPIYTQCLPRPLPHSGWRRRSEAAGAELPAPQLWAGLLGAFARLHDDGEALASSLRCGPIDALPLLHQSHLWGLMAVPCGAPPSALFVSTTPWLARQRLDPQGTQA